MLRLMPGPTAALAVGLRLVAAADFEVTAAAAFFFFLKVLSMAPKMTKKIIPKWPNCVTVISFLRVGFFPTSFLGEPESTPKG